MTKVLPTFGATVVDFVVHTALLAGVIALSTQEGGAVRVWRRTTSGRSPATSPDRPSPCSLAGLYLWLGIAGMLLGIPPLVPHLLLLRHLREAGEGEGHLRRRARQLPQGARRLGRAPRRAPRRAAQGGGGDRARAPHPDRPPPHRDPRGRGAGARPAHRVPGRDGRRLLRLHPLRRRAPRHRLRRRDGQGARRGAHHGDGALAAARRHRAGQARLRGHGRGQRRADARPRGPAPAVLPHAGPRGVRPRDAHASSSPAAGTTRCSSPTGERAPRCPRAAPRSACAPGWSSPRTSSRLAPGTTVALYTDGLTEARDPDGTLFGLERLESSLERCQNDAIRDTLEGMWDDIAVFRGESAPTDDATLLLARLT